MIINYNANIILSIFLDVAKAFDAVWYNGHLFKLKTYFPTPYYFILK